MDEIKAAYDRIDDAVTPPGDAVRLVEERVTQRRRRRQTVRAVAGSVAAVAVIAGATWALQGDEPATGPADPASSDWSADDTSNRDSNDPPQVAERDELTVREENLTCPGPTQIAVVRNPADYSGSEDGPETVEPWLLPDTGYGFYRVDDNQIVARLSTQDDEVYAELGLIAIKNQWRVESVTACTSAYPGLDWVVRDASIDAAPGLLTAVTLGGCSSATLHELGQDWRPDGPLPDGVLGVGQTSDYSGESIQLRDLSGARITFVPDDGQEDAACTEGPSAEGPLAQLDVTCEGASWRVGTVINPEAHASRRYRDVESAVQPWLRPSWTYDLVQLDPISAVANLVAPNDAVPASIGLTRIDGFWRVESVSACTTDFPGLEAAYVFGSGLPLVELVAVDEGHCWVETLFYRGGFWDLRDEDQFGWGGQAPAGFLGIGSVAWRGGGEAFTFTDLSGSRLDFVPADSPGTEANEGGCD